MDDYYLGVSSMSAQRVRRFLCVDGCEPIGYQLADEPMDDFIFGSSSQTFNDIHSEMYGLVATRDFSTGCTIFK